MHFVSEYTETVTVRAYKENYSQATGEKIGATPSAKVQLHRGVAPDWAVQQALGQFKFSNRGLIEVERYCAYVDTEDWAKRSGFDDEVRKRADELLLAKYPTVIAVDPPKPVAPWPSYDKLQPQGRRTAADVAVRNLELAAETGRSIDELIAYEQLTRNNEQILETYRAKLDELEPPAEPAGDIVEA